MKYTGMEEEMGSVKGGEEEMKERRSFCSCSSENSVKESSSSSLEEDLFFFGLTRSLKDVISSVSQGADVTSGNIRSDVNTGAETKVRGEVERGEVLEASLFFFG